MQAIVVGFSQLETFSFT